MLVDTACGPGCSGGVLNYIYVILRWARERGSLEIRKEQECLPMFKMPLKSLMRR